MQTRLLWILCTCLFIAAPAPASRANEPGGHTSAITTSVSTGTVTFRNLSCRYLDNGIIRAIISPAGNVQSLRFLKPGLSGTPAANGIEMISQSGASTGGFGNHTEIYYYWYPDGTAGTTYSATTGTGARMDLAYRRPYNAATHKVAVDVELHYSLGRGDTTLYVYAILDHPAAYPQMDLSFIQMIWPIAHDATNFLCENLYIDDSVKLGLSQNGVPLRRNSLEPNYADIKKAVTVDGLPGEINRLTSGPFAGQLTGKYSYNIQYPLYNAWGRASDVNQIGEWVVTGSHEYMNNGPTMREYVHGWGLLYHQIVSPHYSNRGITVPAGSAWTKVLGPWGLYFNGLPTGLAAWADAKAQGEAEKAAWPYSWLAHPAYQPAAKRATLTGRLVLTDPLRPGVNAAGAWVGLAASDSGEENATDNWQFQSDRPQFWTRAAADGTFAIPAIQTTSVYGGAPETYRLYAYSAGSAPGSGAVGEFRLGSFTFAEGETRALGVVPLTVPHPGGSLVWEIGVPDRSAAEFRHGDEYAAPALWLNYGAEFSNPLNYDVASGNWASALNFSHTVDYVGATPWRWNLNFNLTSLIPGTYWLTIAYASADSVQIVRVNDDSAFATFTPPNARPGASSFLRQAVQTKATYVRVAIPSSRLRLGANTIALDHEVHTNHATAGFMYDYISLEAPTPPVLPPGRDLTWKGGAASNAWDVSAANWTLSGTTTPTLAFVDGDRPRFDDTGSISPALALAGILRPGQITFANTTARAYTLGGAGVLAGPFQFLKPGNGSVTVSPYHQNVVSSFTAGSPVVAVASTSALYPGLTYVSSSAAADFPAGSTIVSVNSGAGTVTLSGNAVTTRSNVTLGFGSAHTFDGGAVLSAGTVTLANATANVAGLGSGTVTLAGGTLSMWDNISTTHSAPWSIVVPVGSAGRLNASSRVDLQGSLSGGGDFTLYVPYVRTTLAGNWSAFTGRVNVLTDANGGDLRFGNTAGCPAAAFDLGPLVTAYSTLAGSPSIRLGELSGSATAKLAGGGTGVTTWVVGSRQTDATFYGAVANGAAPAVTALNKVGAGTWTLAGACTQTGPTLVSDGTLQLSGSLSGSSLAVSIGAAFVLTGSAVLAGDVANDGLLDLAGASSLSVGGALVNRGALVLRGGAALSIAGSFLNQGVVDAITSSKPLPAGLVNEGVVLDASVVRIAQIELVDGTALVSIASHPGHSYRLQRRDSLVAGDWTDVGAPQEGAEDTTLTFSDTANPSATSRFYRIVVGP